MTLALLVLIAMMWIPVGLMFLGYGEPKGTGFVTGVVGIIVVVGATIECILLGPAGAFATAPLFVFGILYLQVSHALLAGLEDLRTLGNGALVVAIVCAFYAVMFATGTAKPDGTVIIAKAPYLAFMYTTFTVLCLAVMAQGYGKIGAKLPAWLLIILSFTCLLAPSFSVFATGKFPF
ncbi:MAG: AmiS/UreI family transporter [Geobacteraceae bacterium]|nr:AmiS/UreI family transporter [Geobacteraceae bacterium]